MTDYQSTSGDGIANSITEVGVQFIKSIRHNYNDVQPYKSW